MRAHEFINESKPTGKMPKDLKQKSKGAVKMRDVGGYDRVYHLNRIMMAAGMSDGTSSKAVDMDSASFVEKYNVAFPYTDAEHLMVMAAMATIPTDGNELEKRSKSQELPDTNIKSTVPDRNNLKK